MSYLRDRRVIHFRREQKREGHERDAGDRRKADVSPEDCARRAKGELELPPSDRPEGFLHRVEPPANGLQKFWHADSRERKGDIPCLFGTGGAFVSLSFEWILFIASVDESVGRILQTLDELKLAEKTLVIFTSDNGGVGGYVREGINRETEITDNAPLRSGKGSLYEGGTRVPFIVRWPGVTKASTECQAPTIHVDFYPTMLEVLGSPKPSQTLDGETLVPLWRDPRASLERDAIYQHFPGYLGAGKSQWRTTPVSLIQSGQWKLMEFLEDGRIELYNLASDMGESRNLAMELPHKAKELNDKLIAWRKEIAAPMPTRNDPATQPNQPLKKRKATQSSG
ncbi:sulfatase-like hydrolase/transferase [bacterium]|nr:sulfatase-like hydrolase/transferase [bacterium]